MNGRRWILVFSVIVTVLALQARAAVTVAPVYSDNMVLQQGTPLRIWGWADDGEAITVRFHGRSVKVTAVNLAWEASLPAFKASGVPETLSITTKTESIQFTNVLVGEVWVCSGQSNMEFTMLRAYESGADIAAATNAQIRLFKVPHNRTLSPTVRIDGHWQTLTPESAGSFSAVGYYFGRAIQQARQAPVGLIGTHWGGTPARAWMNRASLEINPRYREEVLRADVEAQAEFQTSQRAYEDRKAVAEKDGKAFRERPPRQPWCGYELYDGMIAPLVPFPIKGAIWYQGENDAGQAELYRTIFPDLIRCWRRVWQQPEMPFLCVQLAPFKLIRDEPGDSDWAELRDAQLLATKALPKVGMAVITDVGEEKDIHPRKKQPVGERLALAARAIAYGEKIEYSGPVCRGMQIEGNRVILSFNHAGRGLEARDGELKGFAICGADRRWVWATAQIRGRDQIVVGSPQVAAPVAVRYGWADFPVVNLWNKEGLPATPFRTDDFPLITAPKR